MKNLHLIILTLVCLPVIIGYSQEKKAEDWIDLFNGKDLSGWKVGESPESFKVVDGLLMVNGQRSHLFYIGDGTSPVFKNFELNIEVMAYKNANSGIYFHTIYQEEGWPKNGYEVQVNNSYNGTQGFKEIKKTGSLYGIKNVYKPYAKDSSWFTMNIRVVGRRVQIKVDDKIVTDHIEPLTSSRFLGQGTFALQGHDPGSTVLYKNIKVRRLDNEREEPEQQAEYLSIVKVQSQNFAFIDTHVYADRDFNINAALKAFYSTGINLGIVVSDSIVKNDQEISAFINQYKAYPVFLGLEVSDINTSNVLKATSAQFDYVIGEIDEFKNSKGKKISLRSVNKITDREAFMNDYVRAIVENLNKKILNIWAAPTLLPKSIAIHYTTLWTKERMLKVIEAAKQNGVAIEINNGLKIPSIEFLKLAKAKGSTFSSSGMYRNGKMNEPVYFMEAIEKCKLDYKDIYIPGN